MNPPKDLLIAGIAVHDYPHDTPARRKRLREVGRDAVSRETVDRLVARATESTDLLAADLRAHMDELVAEFRESKTYQQEVIEQLRPDLERTLAQVHDYKQFVQQIIQNVNVVLESRYPEIPFDEKLERASHAERAIYWAAVIMDEKLEAAAFLDAPERIHEPREQGRARLHGMVLKYIRIYQSRADAKRVSIVVSGDSWGTVYGNQRALGIIPHTLIDNAIKYAPEGSRIDVTFRESNEAIDLEVQSFGPEITPAETSRIFDLFFRAEAACRASSEGTGFGLASAQNVARAHDTEIVVEQTRSRGPSDTFLTAFSVRFKRAKDRPAGGT